MGGFGSRTAKNMKVYSPASAVSNSRNSKTEKFPFHFEKKKPRAKFKKVGENFSVLGRNPEPSGLRAEAGR